MKHDAQDLVKDCASATKIAISCDGKQQKSYGRNSLLGDTFIISTDNGCVLDYSIKSKTSVSY